MPSISSYTDVINSLDVIARIEALEDVREDLRGELEEAEKALEEWDKSEDSLELSVLSELAEQCAGASDWEYGAELIADFYFVDYARQFAEDTGMMPEGADRWPLYCIDWDYAATELKSDYMRVTFCGQEYWVRVQ